MSKTRNGTIIVNRTSENAASRPGHDSRESAYAVADPNTSASAVTAAVTSALLRNARPSGMASNTSR